MASAKGKGDVKIFNNREDLSVSLAKYIADLSDKFIKDRGAFTIVLSGGDLFESLGFVSLILFFHFHDVSLSSQFLCLISGSSISMMFRYDYNSCV